MKRSLINQRQMLWVVVLLLLVLCVLPTSKAEWISRTPRSVVETLTMPLSHPVRLVAMRFYQKPVDDQETIDSLRRQRDDYHRLAYKMQLMLEEERALNQQFQQMRELFGDFSNQIFVTASVGYSSQSFRQMSLRLNRGRRHGLDVGQVVSSGSQLVGRISNVNMVSSTVTLITEPKTTLMVRIVPPGAGADGTVPRQVEAILEVADDGQGFYGTVDVNRTVRVGDIAFLADNQWPRDGFIVGRVVDAQTSPNDPLRMRVRVEPEQPLHRLSSVTVLVPEASLRQRDTSEGEGTR
jgi:cell shape-determining protein MreC